MQSAILRLSHKHRFVLASVLLSCLRAALKLSLKIITAITCFILFVFPISLVMAFSIGFQSNYARKINTDTR